MTKIMPPGWDPTKNVGILGAPGGGSWADKTKSTAGGVTGSQPTTPNADPQTISAKGKGQSVDAASGGQFGMGQVWSHLAEHKPGENDVEGNALKDTFMYDAATSQMNHQQSVAAGWQNAEIQSNLMNQTADLELRNTGANMDREFNYGMTKMGTEADIQENFAQNEAIRDVSKMGFAGDIQQAQTGKEGLEQREGMKEQGTQDRSTMDTAAGHRKTEQETQGTQDRLNMDKASEHRGTEISNQGTEDRLNIDKQSEAAVAQIGAQGGQDRQNITSQGTVDVGKITAQGGIDVNKIKQSGMEDRSSN